jgi:transposase
MPTVTKSRSRLISQGVAPVTPLASRDRGDVPTAKRRAGRRSEPTQEQPHSAEKQEKLPKNRAILPPPGENPCGTPTRSMTQVTQGDQGRMTVRTVALDLGVKKTSYCELSQGQVVQRITVSEVSSLEHLLGPNQPPARVAIEACREAWFVHDTLVQWGNEVVVIDTTRSKQMGIGQHGRKNDRIDAEVLARALECGRIPKAHVLSPARRELRRVLAVRRTLVEARAQLITTVRGLVREQGARIPSCQSRSFASRVRAQRLEADIAQLIEPLLVLVEGIDTQLSSTDEQLEALCAQEPTIATLTTTPGVGTVIAACFVAVVDDAKRFHRAHQVESYVGLVPAEDSSGGKRRLGAISKQGNSYLRSLLVQAAWTIIRCRDKSNPLYLWVKQLIERRGKQIAVVALARRLVGVLWAMWRDGTVYDTTHLARQNVRGVRGAIQNLEQQSQALSQAANKHSVKHPSTDSTATCRRRTRTPAAKAA